jgi:homoserine O-acetyltransferase
MLSKDFAGELFGPGPAARRDQVLHHPARRARRRQIVEAVGRPAHEVPHYNYDDMVEAQYRLVSEGLGVRHLRLVLGNSMGGMHTWVWGVKYPAFMDALVPMASQPTEMSGRNWMMRRMLIDAIRKDPDWNDGNYTAQPKSLRMANVYFGIATNGGSQAYYKAAPTREKADKLVDDRLAAPFTADANDFLYQWESSGDYNPSPGLGRIEAPLLAITSADDERNPPELKIMERELARVKNARLFLIPASDETRGHGTTAFAKFWKQQLQDLLASAPRRGM